MTGANSGLGKELVKILYSKHAKVYVAARSESKAKKAIEEVRQLYPTSKGELAYLYLDLSDLATIKKSADDFLAKEQRLDVLFNNAGVMTPPVGSKTVQGYELQLGVNSIGTFLFTRCLNPTLAATARSAPQHSVRVVWVSSAAADSAPKPAIDFSNMDYKRDEDQWQKYERSKAGNILHSCEAARRSERDGEGVLHVVSGRSGSSAIVIILSSKKLIRNILVSSPGDIPNRATTHNARLAIPSCGEFISSTRKARELLSWVVC